MRCKSCKENKLEKCSQKKKTYTSKGPDVTLRNTGGHNNSDVFKHASGNREDITDVER